MSKHAMPEMKEGGCNVTPLIDVIMCLIIFFMLVARVGVASGIDKTILAPETLLGVQIKDIGNTLTLNVKEAKGADEPLVTCMLPEDKSGKAKEVKIRAGNDKPLERLLTAAKKANKDFKIIILAEQVLPYHQLEQVLVTCAMAGVTEINFKTKQSKNVDAG